MTNMGRKLTIVVNIILLYSAIYTLNVTEPINEWMGNDAPRYVPKSKRWKRLKEVKEYLTEQARKHTHPIIKTMSDMEESWHEYYANRVPEMEYNEARRRHRIAESMADNYSPLTREAWEENMLRYNRKRKRKFQHPNWTNDKSASRNQRIWRRTSAGRI